MGSALALGVADESDEPAATVGAFADVASVAAWPDDVEFSAGGSLQPPEDSTIARHTKGMCFITDSLQQQGI
jgi:hypothetical protein